MGQWYSGASSRSAATAVTLAAGESQAGIDATLEPGGRIAGTVTVPGGGAPQAVEVCAQPAAGGESAACGYTEGDGYYEIAGLATGSYKVEFTPGYECGESTCEQSPYEVEFWHGAKTLGAATSVSVTVGATQKDIDATMTVPGAPTATQAPALSGTPALGQTLTCGQGGWSGEPTGYSYAWLRDGTPIGGAAGTTYAVTDADAGHSIACRVTATNAIGSNSADSAALEVPKPPSPENTETKVTPTTAGNPSASGPAPAGNPPDPSAGKATTKPTAKVKGGKAIVTVSCGGAPCKGTLKLTVKSKGKKIVLGKASFSLAAGKSATVKVKLSKAALAMIEEAGAKGLKVSLAGSGIKVRSLKLKM